MKLFPRRRVLVGFVLGAFFFVVVIASSFSTNQSYQQAINELNQHKQVDTDASSLLTQLLNAETGQRGYIITGNSTYLQPYDVAVVQVDSTDQALKSAIGNDANLTAEYAQLQPIIVARLGELNQTITVRQIQGFSAAQAIVNSNVGEVYMDDIRAVITKMVTYNDAVTVSEQASVNSLATQRLENVYFNGTLAVAFFVFAIYSLGREYAREEALVAKETASRTQAQLLQDILTHDIRNFNQIARANAELLEARLQDETSREYLESIQKATDGSSELIQKTRMLASIMASPDKSMEPVDLEESITRSLSLVQDAYIYRKVEASVDVDSQARVLADGLLDEVFVNIFTNAVKYSDETVQLEIKAEKREEDTGRQTRGYWLVSITDHGRGIPDENKLSAFTRYLGSTKGRGLGLSIVRALVVDRYSGRIELKNRVDGDHTKGTRVEIWLPARQ